MFLNVLSPLLIVFSLLFLLLLFLLLFFFFFFFLFSVILSYGRSTFTILGPRFESSEIIWTYSFAEFFQVLEDASTSKY